jgi:hypothetical protein
MKDEARGERRGKADVDQPKQIPDLSETVFLAFLPSSFILHPFRPYH